MSLIELLLERSTHADTGITFIEGNDQESFLSYAELNVSARKALSFLQLKGMHAGDELVFQLDDNRTFLVVFWACIFGGIIPVPLSSGTSDDHRQKIFNVWMVLSNPYLITADENLQRLQKHAAVNNCTDSFNDILAKVLPVQDIFTAGNEACLHTASENDIAYVQFSSGSTGSPKGVVLTHKNLITNINAILNGINSPESGDTFFSWMPLTHDMGLIGFHLTPLLAGWQHYLMPTSLFIRRPLLWLEKISQHRISFTASPNFGYRYVSSRLRDNTISNLDLSCLRIIVNGAEPISPAMCKEFSDIFGACGLRENAIFPVYGLAEASLAVTFTDPNDSVRSISINRAGLAIGDSVKEVSGDEGLTVANVGKVIDNCAIKITDYNDTQLGESCIGRILIKGDNVTAGYYNNAAATSKVVSAGGWLDTGDLGFVNNGDLFITGRAKDVIFINGQNYYSHDIERKLEELKEIEQGKIAVSAFTNQQQSEEVLVFALYKGKAEEFVELAAAIKKQVNRYFGFSPDQVIPVRDIPKTTSGKVQRFKLAELYKNGQFEQVMQELTTCIAAQSGNEVFIAAGNETEEKLAGIWSQVLQHRNFGATTDFFEIGGNSLKGAQILSLIHREFNVNLDYTALFEKQTIREMADAIVNAAPAPFEVIQKIPEAASYELSPSQKRLYYFWELDKSAVAYNIPLALRVSGSLDVEKLERAFGSLVKKHESLRTKFILDRGEPASVICPGYDVKIKVTNITGDQLDAALKSLVQPFDLSAPVLFRAAILEISGLDAVLFFDIHHIIADGVSVSLLIEELFRIYSNEKIHAAEIQFKDYVNWQAGQENMARPVNTEYWANKFSDGVPVLNLPVDHVRPSFFNHKGEKLNFIIEEDLVKQLQSLARQENTSLFVLLFTAYNVLLSKYTGQDDIVVGIPVAGRSHLQLQPLIGMFVNNLAMRSLPAGNLTFRNFLNQVTQNVLNDFNHQEYSFGNLLEDIDLKRDISRNPVFDTMFVYQNMGMPVIKNEGISITSHLFDPGISKFDLTMEVLEEGSSLKYFLEYAVALFERDTVNRFATHFKTLLKAVVNSADTPLADLSILSGEEYQQSILRFNSTASEFPAAKTVQDLFHEQVLQTPHSVAIVAGGKNNRLNAVPVTYKQLDEYSNQFASCLLKKGVTANTPVAVILDRTPEFVISVLGILKAGSCYLPIDRDMPADRVDYILRNSKTTFLITDSQWLQKSGIQENGYRGSLQVLNVNEKELYQNEPVSTHKAVSSANLCYIIYTSGTTGNPKGTMVAHKSLVNYLTWAKEAYLKNEVVSFPLYTSISFDLSITSLFLPLVTGNTIVTYADNEDLLPIEEVIEDNLVQVIKVTPSHLKILRESPQFKANGYVSKLHTFIVGGESFSSQLANDIHHLFGGAVKLHNEYGPTEATIGCMIYTYRHQADNRQSVPIGIPINNTAVYILDNCLKPVPDGVLGELHIAGDCLSEGYLFNQELNEAKFISNPFVAGQLMYKSGDLVRMLPGGQVEFTGRKDKLVKINGYRIELEEIEKKLLEHKEVTDTVVICRKNDSGQEYLNAYICRVKGEENDVNEQPGSDRNIFSKLVRTFLFRSLPSYMIPRYITEIDKIPLTRNGKVDEKLLPEPVSESNYKESEAVTATQEMVLGVWRKIFSNNEIGIQDNFFELGGDSIKAVQISSALIDHNIYVKTKDILVYQTVEQLCKVVNIQSAVSEYDQGLLEGETGLTPVQHWFFNQNLKNPDYYNQSVLLRFKKNIDRQKVEDIFSFLVRQHDGLRMNYDRNKNVMFYNNKHLEVKGCVDAYNLDAELFSGCKNTGCGKCCRAGSDKLSSNNELTGILNKVRSSFDITNTLLIKPAIIKSKDAELLFITAHHLVIDGISWRIILDTFYKMYNESAPSGIAVPVKKTASLTDYCNSYVYRKNHISVKEQEYWSKNRTAGFPGITDGTSAGRMVKNVKTVRVQLTYDSTDFLVNGANRLYNTNAEILLITALLKTVRKWNGGDDITVELENHGRKLDDVDVSRTIGWFTSIYPVSFLFNQVDTGSQVKYVKEVIREIPDGGIDYGILRYMVKKAGFEGASPDIRFNYLGQFGDEINNDLFSLIYGNTGIESDAENAFGPRIDINALVLNGKLHLEISFDALADEESAMQQLAENYKTNIQILLDFIQYEGKAEFTPSDFAAVELNNEDLDVLFG
jgi:amino acid adenylation domain-containing protein/non-ribosomal peptide synthase protein (TIGR01720 family)